MPDYDVGIKTGIDINEALNSINKLQDNLKQMSTEFKNVNKAIKNANAFDDQEKDIKRYQQQLDKANKELKNYKSTNDKLNKTIDNQSKEIKKLEKEMKDYKSGVSSVKKEQSGMFSDLQNALGKITLWGVATTAIYGTKRALEETVQVIKEVNAEMVNLQKVMNPAITNFQEMKEVATDLGLEFAQSTQNVLKSMVDWGRQGRRQLEVLELTEASLLAANVAELETAESVRYLTSAVLQFNIDASEATEIVDKWNETSNNFATTSRDLAESIKEAGAAAHNAGINIDELIGMTTALTASTGKSGNRIGNALKTMFSRIRGDMNSVAEDVLGKVEGRLNDIGIALRVNQTTYRDTTAVLSDLASQWSSLDEVMRDNIARAIGGRRRYSDVISLMENWDIAMSATRTSMDSLNSAVDENKIYMESLEAQWNQALQAGNKLSVTIGDAGVTNALKTMSNALGNTFKLIDDFVTGFSKMHTSLKIIIPLLVGGGGLIVTLQKLGVTFASVKATITGFSLTSLISAINPVTAGITAIIAVIGIAVTKWGQYQKIVQEANKAKENFNKITTKTNELTNTEVSNIQKQIDSYKELTRYARALMETEEMAMQRQVATHGRIGAFLVDLVSTSEYEKNIDLLRETFTGLSIQFKEDEDFLKAVTKQIYEYETALRNSASALIKQSDETWESVQAHRAENDYLQKQVRAYNELKKTKDENIKDSIRYNAIVADLEKKYPELIGKGDKWAETLQAIANESQEDYGFNGEEIKETIGEIESYSQNLNKSLDDLAQIREEQAAELVKLNEELKNTEEGTQAYYDLKLEIYEVKDALENTNSQIVKTNEQIKENKQRLEQLKKEYEDVDAVQGFFSKLENITDPLTAINSEILTLLDSIENLKNSLANNLRSINVFSGIEGLSDTEILQERIKAYEQAQKSAKKIYNDLLENLGEIKNIDQEIAKWKEQIGYYDFAEGSDQRTIVDEYLSQLDSSSTKEDIEKVMSNLVQVLYTSWQEEIDSMNDLLQAEGITDSFDAFYNSQSRIREEFNKIADAREDLALLEEQHELHPGKILEEDVQNQLLFIESLKKGLTDMLNPFDNVLNKFDTLKDKISNIKNTVLKEFNLLSIFSDSTGNNRLEEEINVYQNAIENIKDVYSELYDLAGEMDKSTLIEKTKEMYNYDILTDEEKLRVDDILKQIKPESSKEDIQELMSQLADIMLSTYQTEIDNRKDEINLNNLLSLNKEDIRSMAIDQLKTYRAEIEKELQSTSGTDRIDLLSNLSTIDSEIYEENIKPLESTLNNIYSTFSSIAGIKEWQNPILNGTAVQNVGELRDGLRNINETMLSVKPDDISSWESYVGQLEEFVNMVPYLSLVHGIDLTEMFNMEEFIERIEEGKDKIKELRLFDLAESNFQSTLTPLEKLQNQLELAKENLDKMTDSEAIKNQEAYIEDLKGQIREMNTEGRTDNFFDYLNRSIETTKTLLNEIDLNELTINESKEAIKILSDELKRVQKEILLIYSNQDNMSNEEFLGQLEKFGLTGKQIKETIKLLKENIEDTQTSWKEAIMGGIIDAVNNFDSAMGFAEKLTSIFRNVFSNVFKDDKLKSNFADLLGDGISVDGELEIPGLKLPDNWQKGIMSGLESFAGGDSIAGSIFSGIGVATGNPIFGLIGGIGNALWGGVDGLEDKNAVEQVNSQIDDVNKQLKEFGVQMDYTKATVKDTEGWWGRLWGGHDYEAYGLEKAKQSLEDMERALARLNQVSSTVGNGLVNAIKNAMNYGELKAMFSQTVGQALQDAVVSKLMETKAIENQIKVFAGEVEKALMDGVISDSEMDYLNQLRDNLAEQGEEIREVLEELGLLDGDMDFDNSVNNSFQAGSTTSIVNNNTYVAQSQYWGGTQEDAEEFIRTISPMLIEELQRQGYVIT